MTKNNETCLCFPDLYIKACFKENLIRMSNVIEQEVTKFHSTLNLETNLSKFIELFKEISSRFSILEEENSLNGCFITVLNLAEQINDELSFNKEQYKLLLNRGVSIAETISSI